MTHVIKVKLFDLPRRLRDEFDEVPENLAVDLVANLVPLIERGGERAFLGVVLIAVSADEARPAERNAKPQIPLILSPP